MPDIEFHVADEWTAVYLDGKLQTVGDSYLADEWLQGYVGVKVVQVVQDDAFMRGGSSSNTVAKTLDELHDYQLERDRKLAQAQKLRDEAQDLLAQAAVLEEKATRAV